ncbi:MAG TPA: alpha/beta hydrolase [Vulgatibacter sp.]
METIDRQEGDLPAKDGTSLHWRRIGGRHPAADVIFVHGYGEHAGRYLELFEFLCADGSLCVHAFDLRGHGRSDGRPAYVERFDDYLRDVDALVERIRGGDRPLFVIGHSLGGLIVARWLEERWGEVAGAVFASPYLRLALTPPRIKVAAARALGMLVPWLPVSSGLDVDGLTRDPEWQVATEQDPLYRTIATPRWFEESNGAQALAVAGAPSIRAPSLVLVPEDDPIASPAAGRAFFDSLGAADKRLVTFPGARHELFHELPETRREAFEATRSWIRAHLASRGAAEGS